MASRDFKNVQALERAVKIITGRVTFSGSGATVTTNAGSGFTVARDGSNDGEYIITLADKYTDLLHCSATYVQIAGSDTLFAQVEAHDVSSAKTIEVHLVNDAGSALAPTNNDQMTFMLLLKNSSVT